MINYCDIVENLLTEDKRYRCGNYLDDWVLEHFLRNNPSITTLKCSRNALIEIVSVTTPYILNDLLKIEIIEDNIIDNDYEYYFFFDDNDELVSLFKKI